MLVQHHPSSSNSVVSNNVAWTMLHPLEQFLKNYAISEAYKRNISIKQLSVLSISNLCYAKDHCFTYGDEATAVYQ